ncbi:hypothetical protein WN51_11126 [Melipona quadrifasciata]|uniref:Uncharacterized protein n=1 Tax=Melipona quadrifasciata TaxID=166423 RepID=A0A0M9A6E8_9HYME|nr:hypothetical protein WN51_11126 [Melipona quadrifasciata]
MVPAWEIFREVCDEEQTARRRIEKDPICSTEKRDELALASDRILGRASSVEPPMEIEFGVKLQTRDCKRKRVNAETFLENRCIGELKPLRFSLLSQPNLPRVRTLRLNPDTCGDLRINTILVRLLIPQNLCDEQNSNNNVHNGANPFPQTINFKASYVLIDGTNSIARYDHLAEDIGPKELAGSATEKLWACKKSIKDCSKKVHLANHFQHQTNMSNKHVENKVKKSKFEKIKLVYGELLSVN